MSGACKWVHETHTIPEYIIDLSILSRLKVDSVMHGDDVINNENGESIYTPFIKLGKYREYKRTQGISTTDITDRILNLNNPDFFKVDIHQNEAGSRAKKFHATISKIVQFFDDRSINKFATGKKVVYVCGTFDVLRGLTRPRTRRVPERSQEAGRHADRRAVRGRGGVTSSSSGLRGSASRSWASTSAC